MDMYLIVGIFVNNLVLGIGNLTNSFDDQRISLDDDVVILMLKLDFLSIGKDFCNDVITVVNKLRCTYTIEGERNRIAQWIVFNSDIPIIFRKKNKIA